MTGMVWCGQVWPGVASRKRAMVRPYQGAAIPGHTYNSRRMVVDTTNKGEVCPRWWPGVAGLAKSTGQRWQAVATLVWPGVWSWQV